MPGHGVMQIHQYNEFGRGANFIVLLVVEIIISTSDSRSNLYLHSFKQLYHIFN
jgi:hypothetical protein